MNIRCNRLKLRITDSKQRITPIRMPRSNPNRKPALAEMSNDAAAEKSGPAEHDDGALVRDRHGSTSLPKTSLAQLYDNACGPQVIQSRYCLLRCMSPLIALCGAFHMSHLMPLSGVKRT
jgi:hypothetical protein